MPYRELQRAVEGRLDEILMNFEPASMNANLQNVEIKGCFYNLSINICKHIQTKWLQKWYNVDLEFTNTLRIIAALVFALPGNVVACFWRAYQLHSKSLQERVR